MFLTSGNQRAGHVTRWRKLKIGLALQGINSTIIRMFARGSRLRDPKRVIGPKGVVLRGDNPLANCENP
jgi:hypothetical protein